MSLGSPAVVTPRALDLRAVQGAVNAIRERLYFIEAAINAQALKTQASTGSGDTTALTAQLSALTSRVSALEAQLGLADVVQLTAGDAISAGDVVVPIGATSCVAADPLGFTDAFAPVGVAQTAAAAGQLVRVQRRGGLTVADAAFETGRAVFAQVGGGLTQAPSYAAAAVPVGVATGETTMWVAPGAPSVLVQGVDPYYENFSPASVGLVADALAFMAMFNAAPNGLLVKLGENAVDTRALVAGSGSGLTIADADGVAGDPRFEVHSGV